MKILYKYIGTRYTVGEGKGIFFMDKALWVPANVHSVEWNGLFVFAKMERNEEYLTCKSAKLAIWLVFSASSCRTMLWIASSSRSASLNIRNCRLTSCFMYCVRWSSFATNAIFSGSAINSCSGAIRFCNVCSWLETRSIVSPIWVTGKRSNGAVSAMKPYMQNTRVILQLTSVLLWDSR